MTAGLITSGTVDGSDSGTKIFGGYRFGPRLALELAYVDLGKLSYSGDFSGTPVTGGKVKVSGFNSSLVALHQATPKLGLFAKAGLYAWEAKASDVTGGVPFVVKF
jgi:OOP family OmpA-OmpF porin